MGSKNRYDGIDNYARDVIRYRAKKLIGRAGFTLDDLEDIEQDLTMDLLQRMKQYDPNKAQFNTFVDRIVDHKIANLIRDRSTRKRDYRMKSSADDLRLEDREGIWNLLMETTSSDSYFERMGYQERSMEEQHDLQIDLELLFAGLSENERQLLELLKQMTLTDAARELGVPRTTLDYRLGRLRKLFLNRGFLQYLKK